MPETRENIPLPRADDLPSASAWVIMRALQEVAEAIRYHADKAVPPKTVDDLTRSTRRKPQEDR